MKEPQTWPERIAQMVLIKQAVAEADAGRLWRHQLPRVKAAEPELRAVEAALGEPLDPRYRAFLSFAGGWPAFYQDVDLFGPAELLGGETFARALERLGHLEPNVLHAAGAGRDQLLPIAASATDLDLFALTRRSTATPGVVIWFAGAEVERFPDFDEYFLSMMDYNRREIALLQSRRRGGTKRPQ